MMNMSKRRRTLPFSDFKRLKLRFFLFLLTIALDPAVVVQAFRVSHLNAAIWVSDSGPVAHPIIAVLSLNSESVRVDQYTVALLFPIERAFINETARVSDFEKLFN